MSNKKEKEVKGKKVEEEIKDVKEDKKNAASNNKKKISIKTIVIVVLSIIILMLLGVMGWFIYRNSLESKTTGTSWSDKYYDYLKEQKKAKPGQTYDQFNQKSNISFVQSERMKYPLMIVKCRVEPSNGSDAYDYISLFGIVKDKVKFIGGISNKKVEAKLFYNIENQKYKYYIHATDGNNYNNYTSFDSLIYDAENYNMQDYLKQKGINSNDTDSEEYKNALTEFYQKQSEDPNREVIDISSDDNKVVQKTLDGKELEYNKIDEKLVDTGVEPKYFDYDKNMDTIDIRKKVIEGKEDYKDLNKLVTKAIEKVVKEQIELVEKVKQDIENAKSEIKADEEKKAKEAEEALYAKGLTVGSYNLKFGTYTTSIPKGGIDGSDLYGTITLKPNGQFHIKTNFDQSSFQPKNIDEDGTYTVGKEVNSFETQDAIIFRTNSGYKFSFFVTNNSYFNSQSSIYNYSGN